MGKVVYSCDSCDTPVIPTRYTNRHGKSRVRWVCPKCKMEGREDAEISE
jgi:RNase P subunit RPR2